MVGKCDVCSQEKRVSKGDHKKKKPSLFKVKRVIMNGLRINQKWDVSIAYFKKNVCCLFTYVYCVSHV